MEQYSTGSPVYVISFKKCKLVTVKDEFEIKKAVNGKVL